MPEPVQPELVRRREPGPVQQPDQGSVRLRQAPEQARRQAQPLVPERPRWERVPAEAPERKRERQPRPPEG